MVLAAPSPFGSQQPRVLQHGKMPGERLSREPRLMPADEARVKLEQGLPVTLGELVQETASR